MIWLDVNRAPIQALIPVVGFVASTWTLYPLKWGWIACCYEKTVYSPEEAQDKNRLNTVEEMTQEKEEDDFYV